MGREGFRCARFDWVQPFSVGLSFRFNQLANFWYFPPSYGLFSSVIPFFFLFEFERNMTSGWDK